MPAPATSSGAAWMTIVITVAVPLLYSLYLWLLPKPIPGIPYNKDSAKRLLGDIPNIQAYSGGRAKRQFWSDHATRHQSPIAQYFLGPLVKPSVVISDFREAYHLITRRAHEFGRGHTNLQSWRGIAPEHFIAMDDNDERFSDRKALVKDLMTPSFLHNANAPASYHRTLEFIQLWSHKMRIAEGHPFDAARDLSTLIFDMIVSVGVGLDADNESQAIRQLRTLQELDARALIPANKDALFPFPEGGMSKLQNALDVINESLTKAFFQPFRLLYHFFNNRTARMKKATAEKDEFFHSYIDRSKKRFFEEGGEFKLTSAVDYIVSREIAMARKEGRAPDLDSRRITDLLLVYLIGGSDSTHSTSCFLTKHLADNQDKQAKLRNLLRSAYPEALAQKQQPSLEDILKTSIPYLDAFIEEVLRMSDPTMVLSKGALNDMEILGHVVPKGTIVSFCLTGASYQRPRLQAPEGMYSHDEQYQQPFKLGDWTESDFPADEFWPERWLSPSDKEGRGDVFDVQAGPSLAFSAGKRGCWGKRLAYLELKLETTLFLWNFNFEPLPPGMNDWGLSEAIFIKPETCIVRLSNAL